MEKDMEKEKNIIIMDLLNHKQKMKRKIKKLMS